MKPNIVLIMADDMGYGDLGCFGALKTSTPNMDRIARQGVRFTDMHSASAVCTPSRYGVLTGRYCWRTWLRSSVLGGFGSPLIEPQRMTVASMLKSVGYRTAAVGKWHVGLRWYRRDGMPLESSDRDGWNTDGFDVDYRRGVGGGPNELGFDRWFGISGSLDMPPYCFIEDGRTIGIPSIEKDVYHPQQRRGLMVDGWDDQAVDTTFAGKAVQFIDEHCGNEPRQPFFLYLTPSAPHRPNVPPAFMLHKSEGGLREDMVMVVDWMVGEVLAALERNGVLENTLVMVTSDNGAPSTNFDGKDHGHKPNGDLRGQKADIYEGGHREPFVAMWPTVIPAGRVADELLCLTDLFATIAELVGSDLPRNSAEDSRSFAPILFGKALDHSIHEAVIHHAQDGLFSIRMGDWKLILGTGSGGFSKPARYAPQPGEELGQLYNLRDDHLETLNLWAKRPDIVKTFSDMLDRQQREGRSRDWIH